MAWTPELTKQFIERAEHVIKAREHPVVIEGHTYYRVVLGFISKKKAEESADKLRDVGYRARVVPAHSCTRGKYDIYIRRR